MSRFLSRAPTIDEQNLLIKLRKERVEALETPNDSEVEDYVTKSIIGNIAEACGSETEVTQQFVEDYILPDDKPDIMQVFSDLRKARQKKRTALEWGTGFNLWLNELLLKPHVFEHWFKFLRFPNDLYRSFNLIFEFIAKAKVNLVLHPDYLQIFDEVEDLRIPLSILQPEELHVIVMLKTRHADLFTTQQRIISGNKVIYKGFRPSIDPSRQNLLRRICAHFVSCATVRGASSVPAILDILANSLRNIDQYDIYEELVRMSLPSNSTLTCIICGHYSKVIMPFNNKNLWSYALEIEEEIDISGCPEFGAMMQLSRKQRLYSWAVLLSAYAQGIEEEVRNNDIKLICDRFLLGYEPKVFVEPPSVIEDEETEGVEVTLQVYPPDNPFHIFPDFKDKLTPYGVRVTYSDPSQIYPQGCFGGYYSVSLSTENRNRQLSLIIKDVAEKQPKSGGYVPLAPCLWWLIHYGDLSVLTRIIQQWIPFQKTIRKRVNDNPVPERCLKRRNWKALIEVGNLVRHEQEALEIMWLIIHNFVMVYEAPPLVNNLKVSSLKEFDMFWDRSLRGLPHSISDLVNIETNNQKVTDPSKIFRGKGKNYHICHEVINHSPKVQQGEITNVLWCAFYVAEGLIHGIEARLNKYPQPFLDDLEVTFKRSVVKLDELITITPNSPRDHLIRTYLVRKPIERCHCHDVPMSADYQSQHAVVRISEQRERARKERQQASAEVDMMSQARVMAEYAKKFGSDY